MLFCVLSMNSLWLRLSGMCLEFLLCELIGMLVNKSLQLPNKSFLQLEALLSRPPCKMSPNKIDIRHMCKKIERNRKFIKILQNGQKKYFIYPFISNTTSTVGPMYTTENIERKKYTFQLHVLINSFSFRPFNKKDYIYGNWFCSTQH